MPASEPVAVEVDELLARHGSWLRSLVRRRMADPALVDDVVQETLLRVCRSTPPAAPGHLRPWLASIAKRTCVDVWRVHASSRAAVHSVDESVPAPAAAVPGSDEHLAAVDCRARINEAMVRLPPRHRRLLEKQAMLGLSYEEIAHEEALSLAGVTSALGRARAGFRRRYGDGEARHAPAWVMAVSEVAHRIRARVGRAQEALVARVAELAAATFTLAVVAAFTTGPVNWSVAVDRPADRPGVAAAAAAGDLHSSIARPSPPAASRAEHPTGGTELPDAGPRRADRPHHPVGSVVVGPPGVELTPEQWRVDLTIEVGGPGETAHVRSQTTLHCEGSQVVVAVCPVAAAVPGATSSR